MSSAQPTSERPPPTTIAEAVGGPLGMAETAIPAVAFVVTYTVTGSDTNASAIVAVGIALLLTVARLVRRVAFAAFVATRSGKAENFFLPGLLLNSAMVAALVLSILARWPLIGVIVSNLDGEGSAWRDDPLRAQAFRRATWLWAGLFSARLLVQTPMYLAGAVVALGVARTAMGLPLFALGLWITWLLVRGVRAPQAAPGA